MNRQTLGNSLLRVPCSPCDLIATVAGFRSLFSSIRNMRMSVTTSELNQVYRRARSWIASTAVTGVTWSFPK